MGEKLVMHAYAGTGASSRSEIRIRHLRSETVRIPPHLGIAPHFRRHHFFSCQTFQVVEQNLIFIDLLEEL